MEGLRERREGEMKSSIDIYSLPCVKSSGYCYVTQEAQLSDDLDAWDGGVCGREAQKGEDICTHIAGSLLCTAKTNTTLKVTLLQFFKGYVLPFRFNELLLYCYNSTYMSKDILFFEIFITKKVSYFRCIVFSQTSLSRSFNVKSSSKSESL